MVDMAENSSSIQMLILKKKNRDIKVINQKHMDEVIKSNDYEDILANVMIMFERGDEKAAIYALVSDCDRVDQILIKKHIVDMEIDAPEPKPVVDK